MSGFDAGTVTDAMTYDFTAFGGGSGTIPEPTSDQIVQFFEEYGANLRQIAAEGETEEETTEDRVAKANARNARTKEIFARLCSDTPSKDDFDKLPHRVMVAFVAWMMGQLRPEASTSATTQ